LLSTKRGTLQIVIKSWRELRIAGKTIITEICKSIDESDLFLADLTYLNPNVLFELGYAIAKNKRICIFLDPNIEKTQNDFKRFNLTTLGYIPYSNSETLVNKFFENKPYDDLNNTLLEESLRESNDNKKGLLYIKSLIDTEASIRLHKALDKSQIKPLIIDDPKEVRIQMHNWYVQQTFSAYAVVGHLLSEVQSGKDLHNAKVSFVLGLAHGFGKNLIIFAHDPYNSPLDYLHLIYSHRTGYECEVKIKSWLQHIEAKYEDEQKKEIKYEQYISKYKDLKNLDIGDYVAEQEYDTLKDYFIPTQAYREALNSNYAILIGRKGSGKSAILFQLEYELLKDIRNHVCVIKPVAYELNGLVSLLTSIIGNAEKGYLIESLWKYLIYSEIIKSIYEFLKSKPIYYNSDDYESKIIELVESNKDILLDDFSNRLEYAINQCQNINKETIGVAQKHKISEILHDSLLSKFRELLINYFNNKNRIVVLIDNLDKTWKHGPEISYLSKFLLGLFSVSKRISEDFKSDGHKKKNITFSIVIFLRTDIFSYIYHDARERDKLRYYVISWDDPEILYQIIEERFKNSSGIKNPNEIWRKFFSPTVQGQDIKKFIIKNIIPRPRDLLFLIKSSLANAVARKHEIITEQDLIDAVKRYSQHAFDSLIVENGINVDDFEKLLYEFVGSSKIITEEDVSKIIKKTNIVDINCDDFIDILFERGFLGFQISETEFRFQTNYLEKEKIFTLSRKYLEREIDKIRKFEINIPYRNYLEIK
jgi:hypothetical protein